MIKYNLGENNFKVLSSNSENKKINVLNAIKERLLQPHGSTGVTQLLEYAVFKLLDLITIFPVEDQTHLTDHDNRILPDVFLVQKGTTAKQFAAKIHSDLADGFIHGVLVSENNKRISAEYQLNHGDIIKIVSTKK